MPPQIKYIIVHHAGGTDSAPLADSSNYTVAMCDADHKARFNMLSSLGHYCGYTYFIDKAGVVTQTRKDGEEGAHTIGYNSNSIGICLAGNFDVFKPTEAQIISLTKLLKEKSAQYNIPAANIVPHRKFSPKSCFGKLLSDTWAADLIKTDVPVPNNNKAIVVEIEKHLAAIAELLKKVA